MINVATVHWQDMRWLEVQLGYLERFIDPPYRIWAFVGKDGGDYVDRLHYANQLPIRPHAWKLDLLGDLICEASDDDDLILFIDGDAFPIAPLLPYIDEKLADYPLAAIRRDENSGDPQPHPCFCATTAGFWHEIEGTWQRGATWPGPSGEPVTDVGGNLWKILTDRGVDWYPILRTNARDLHPLLFGVYGDVIYHHGAGFHRYGGGRRSQALRRQREAELDATWRARLIDALPHRGPLRHLGPRHPRRAYRRELNDQYTRLNERVYERVVGDEDFVRMFTDSERPDRERLELPPLVAEIAA